MPSSGASVSSASSRTRVARDVRQRLLRDAVDDELLVGRELGQLPAELLVHLESESLGEALAQDGERALEPEVVKRLGSQLDRDPPHVLEASANRALNLSDVVTQARRDAGLDPREPEQDRGQLLPDLVVQLLCDPQPLGLLRRRAPCRSPPAAPPRGGRASR